jgi:hypothetical protein
MRGLRWIPVVVAGAMMMPGSPVAAVLSIEPAAAAQMKAGQRLILKDGSYQAITKYEVKGDRVRYYSAEREDWEEVPNALVDWTATKEWNQSHGPGGAVTPLHGPQAQASGQNGNAASGTDTGLSEAAKVDAEAAAVRAEERARRPVVAPGLHLPDRDGIFVLDDFQGIPELVYLEQTQGVLHHDASHDVLRAAIASFHGAQEPVRIEGQAARVRLHVNDPALYVSLDTRDEQMAAESAMVVDTHGASSTIDKNEASSPDSRYAIVKLDVQPGERVIGAMRISRVGGAQQNEDIIPTTAEMLPGKHWMKLTPKEPLDVGEYALMEILGPGQINLDVWDFGVSPNAPENKHPITPVKSGGE